MSSSAAVVIPVYKNELEWYEKISLRQAQKVFHHNPIIFVVPEAFTGAYIPPVHTNSKRFRKIYFPARFFSSIEGYNELMLSAEFYRVFESYEYILIYQLDAFAFSDQLEEFCNLGYDYIGAPWPFHCGHLPGILGRKVFLHVGNGGFSLRKTKACIELLEKHASWVKAWNYTEDAFFSYYGRYGNVGFKLAPVNIAYQFAWDFYPSRYVRKTKGVLPFGCHSWQRRDASLYVKAFALAGWDLLPFLDKMESRDAVNKPFQLQHVAYQRLLSRIKSGRKISMCLPKNVCWKVILVGKENFLVAEQLLSEGLLVSGVEFFDSKQVQALAEEIKTTRNTPNLIVQCKDDDLLMELQLYGLSRERDYQSFWQYYITYASGVLRHMITPNDATDSVFRE